MFAGKTENATSTHEARLFDCLGQLFGESGGSHTQLVLYCHVVHKQVVGDRDAYAFLDWEYLMSAIGVEGCPMDGVVVPAAGAPVIGRFVRVMLDNKLSAFKRGWQAEHQ